ncbi:MAG: mechanosensitive ion channel family protein, partial [Candidatus Gastranaerophilales bacterium]|nr:mechanosensitive ion channel family protein [Candidatus Gastranaerophilales bacterium]
ELILQDIISKINFALIVKLCLEVLFFFICIHISKKFIHLFFSKAISKIQDDEVSKQYSTIRFLCISIANTIIFLFFASNLLGDLGIDMKPILATAGVFGVAIGFGAKRFVEDIISGLVILLSGQIRVGDYVTIYNSTGTVEKINLAMIVVRSYNGDVNYIRNGLVEKVVNHTRDFSHPIVDVPVSYESDIPYVIKVLRDLCGEIRKNPDYAPYILSEPEIIAIDAFSDSSILLRVRFKTTAMKQWAVHRYFRIMIKQRFDELKITIPFNQMDVHICPQKQA